MPVARPSLSSFFGLPGFGPLMSETNSVVVPVYATAVFARLIVTAQQSHATPCQP